MLEHIIFAVAMVTAVYVLVAGFLFLTSKKVRCLFTTGHKGRRAIGSILKNDSPHFMYHCDECGANWTEPWE